MCAHRMLDAIDGLACTRLDDHDPTARGGHIYAASSAPDAHDTSEAAAERTRG